MKPTGLLSPRVFFALAFLVAFGGWEDARAQVYVALRGSGAISEYDEGTGAVMNAQFIQNLNEPCAVSIANGELYVCQDGGSINLYNARTGALIREDFIRGLKMPQAFTVAGDAIYVGDTDWQTGFAKIEKYSAYNGALINAHLVDYAPVMKDGMNFGSSVPSMIAVSGHRLFVAGVGMTSSLCVYDATTGALITDRFFPVSSGASGLAVADKWLYFCIGFPGRGAFFRLNPETGKSPVESQGFPRPMNYKMDDPRMLAISGDDLLVNEGTGTAISKYNAMTGEIITANFIPSLPDRLGALAAFPRLETAAETAAASQFEWHKTLADYGFALVANGNYFLFGACGVGVLIALFMLALAIRPQPPEPVAVAAEPVEEAPLPDNAMAHEPAVEVPLDPVVEPAVDTVPPPAPEVSEGRPGLALLAVLLLVATLGTAAYLGYSLLAPTGTDLSSVGDRDRDIVSAWQYENETRDATERPEFLSVEIYPDKINFSIGNGPNEKAGKWHDDGFWVAKADGSGEIEVARLVDPLDLEVTVNAFIPSRTDKPVLYKVMGSAAERAAIAAKYPGPLTYPPRKGVITYWMSEYDLNALPWHPDSREITGDEAYSRGIVYHYHSDNPQVPPLLVTVKNRHVVTMSGGYE